MSLRLFPLLASLILTSAVVAPGCTVNGDLADQSGAFTCQSDADCINPFVCQSGLCVLDDGVIPCIDNDQDGYGANPDGERDACRFPEQDPDDNDPSIHHDAPELCDGKDNDGVGGVDDPRACVDIRDCNRDEEVPAGTFFFCEGGVCVLKPAQQVSEECMMPLRCVNGAYEPVPDSCK